jgi:hypothetical protein
MSKTLLLLSLLSLVTACSLPITQAEIEAASFSPEPDRKEYMAVIRAHLQANALDPESIVLSCLDATKGWARRLNTERPSFGWVVACDVNGRNALGGFTGNQPYVFLFNPELILLLRPRDLESAIEQKVGGIR